MPRATRSSAPQSAAASAAPTPRGRPRKQSTNPPQPAPPSNQELAGTVNALSTRLGDLESGQDKVMSVLGEILKNQQQGIPDASASQSDAPGKTPTRPTTRPTPYPRSTANNSRGTDYNTTVAPNPTTEMPMSDGDVAAL